MLLSHAPRDTQPKLETGIVRSLFRHIRARIAHPVFGSVTAMAIVRAALSIADSTTETVTDTP